MTERFSASIIPLYPGVFVGIRSTSPSRSKCASIASCGGCFMRDQYACCEPGSQPCESLVIVELADRDRLVGHRRPPCQCRPGRLPRRVAGRPCGHVAGLALARLAYQASRLPRLGGLLHSPGSFESAVRAGLSAELIDDRTLRDIFRLIARGPLQTVAVVKGSNVTSAGTDAARRLYAETRLLDPACMIGLIADLVGANDNAIGEEPPDDAA